MGTPIINNAAQNNPATTTQDPKATETAFNGAVGGVKKKQSRPQQNESNQYFINNSGIGSMVSDTDGNRKINAIDYYNEVNGLVDYGNNGIDYNDFMFSINEIQDVDGDGKISALDVISSFSNLK